MRTVRTLSISMALSVAAFAQQSYQKPPKAVLDVLNAPGSPVYSVNPTATHVLLITPVRYPPIAELAAPMLRLAGMRINPATNGPHRTIHYDSATLKAIEGGAETKIQLPPGAKIGRPVWSPDGNQFAILNTTPGGIELWVGTTAAGTLRKMQGVLLNDTIADPVQWMPDGKTLLVMAVPPKRGKAPEAPTVPSGPTVQEAAGRSGPVRTYQDMLSSPHDEALFDYYASAQPAFVDPASGKMTPYGAPGLYSRMDPAPDGRHFLVVAVKRPYSYLHPYPAFPREMQIWDRAGKRVHTLASLPLEDAVPIEGVSKGPRFIQWRPTEAATLIWVEALDEGDPRKKVPNRDRVLMLKAPFSAAPVEVLKTEHRFSGIVWGEKASVAMVSDYERDRRWVRSFLVNFDDPVKRQVWSRSVQDRYNAPGSPVMKALPNGARVMRQVGNSVFLIGPGASPEGDRPFLDRMDLDTLRTERLFRSEADRYEYPLAVLNDDGSRVLTSKESPSEPPNLYIRRIGISGDQALTALTNFADPVPQLRKIRKERVVYKRPDGVQLSFTLFLPPDYKEGTRLPTVVWAYPLEYTSADTAGQIGGSTQRFTTLSSTSHLFFLLQGYAVLDSASMPVVGDPETVNNTYIEQVVASAKAAIDKAAEMGVTDPDRVGVGGHSYGAFMTANLLAHSDLFRAGIARSGAYNRTLTPFGFQSERRTLWEAPETYMRMSPFMHAQKIDEPILLIHGEADNNAGTFPVQSERLYHAVAGNGGIVRLVMLPHESHGYSARESVEHTLYEMIRWFDQHVKNAPARKQKASAAGGE